MRVITACDVVPEAGRQGLRLLARPAPAALGVPPRTARTRPALRARRHPEGADPQRVARRVSAAIRVRMSQITWRTRVAHQSTEEVPRLSVATQLPSSRCATHP